MTDLVGATKIKEFVQKSYFDRMHQCVRVKCSAECCRELL